MIRADYTTYEVTDYYNNGLLTGLGLSIKDIAEWDLEKLADNYSYTKIQNEIFDVENIRICIEYRQKQ